MPTLRARSRSESAARPSALTISHAASRISAFVASRRALRLSVVGLSNTVRDHEQRSERCQPPNVRRLRNRILIGLCVGMGVLVVAVGAVIVYGAVQLGHIPRVPCPSCQEA